MSHIVTIKTRMKDRALLVEVCRMLGLADPIQGTITGWDGGQASGLLVNLPTWRFPVAVQPDGSVKCERYNAVRIPDPSGRASLVADFGDFQHWGEEARLNQLLQTYAVEAAKLAARRAGHSVTEQRMADGSVRLTIEEA
jgi:hypothetical protein